MLEGCFKPFATISDIFRRFSKTSEDFQKFKKKNSKKCWKVVLRILRQFLIFSGDFRKFLKHFGNLSERLCLHSGAFS